MIAKSLFLVLTHNTCDLGLQLSPRTCLSVRGASTWPGKRMLKPEVVLVRHIRATPVLHKSLICGSVSVSFFGFGSVRRSVVKRCSLWYFIQKSALVTGETHPGIQRRLSSPVCALGLFVGELRNEGVSRSSRGGFTGATYRRRAKGQLVFKLGVKNKSHYVK